MVFNLRITQFANPGTLPELRGLTEGQVQRLKDEGGTASLSRPVTGQAGRLVLGQAFKSLADLQGRRQRTAMDPSQADYFEKVRPLLSRTVDVEISETLLAPAGDDPPRYLQRLTWTPAPGQGPKARDILLEYFAGRQKSGMRVGVAEAIASGQPKLHANILHGSIDAFEAARAKNRQNPERQAMNDRLAPFVTDMQIELFEVLIPR